MTSRHPHETTSGYLAALASHIHVDPTPSAARAHVVRAVAEARGVRARWRRRVTRLSLLGVALASLISTSGVAVAGHLPPMVQGLVADAAWLMPVPVPIPYPEPSSSDTGMEPAPLQTAGDHAVEGDRLESVPASSPRSAERANPEQIGGEHGTDGIETRHTAEKERPGQDQQVGAMESGERDQDRGREQRQDASQEDRGMAQAKDRDRDDRGEERKDDHGIDDRGQQGPGDSHGEDDRGDRGRDRDRDDSGRGDGDDE